MHGGGGLKRDIDDKLDSLDGGSGTGKGVRGGLIVGATVSDDEPSRGSSERARSLIPIGLEGEKRGQGGYERAEAWMDRFVDIFIQGWGGWKEYMRVNWGILGHRLVQGGRGWWLS